VLGVDWGGGGALLVARVDSPAACPLTFATNYAETLRATLRLEGGRRVSAPVFPVYGALAGVWVAAGATEVRLAAEPREIPLPWAWDGAGAILLLGAAVAAGRGQAVNGQVQRGKGLLS
jgi:hypothetical protein